VSDGLERPSLTGGAAPAGAPGGPGRSIRWRLIVALAGVSLFAVVIVGAVFQFFLANYVVDREQQDLFDRAVATAEQVEDVGVLLPGRAAKTKAAGVLLRAGLRSLPAGSGLVLFSGDQVVAKAGALPAKAQNLERLRAEAAEASRDGPSRGKVSSAVGAGAKKADLLYAAAPVTLGDGTSGLIVVSLARSDALAARSGLTRVLLISAIIAVVVAIGVGWGLAAWLARPLRRLSAAARGLAAGGYEVPLTGSYPGELRELAQSLETARTEVRRSHQSLRGFVASAAHELRTPLTSIQGFSQALLDGTAADREQQMAAAAAISRESHRLQRLLDALLTLSRYDSREFHPTLAPVVVGSLVEEEVERLVQAGLVERERINVRAETRSEAVTDGDMLRQVIANLLRNAVQYGGADPIDVRVGTAQGAVTIHVNSGGAPLSADERDHVFDRFYRGLSARSVEGSGLGLALSREICEVLGGQIELVGAGPTTEFRVTIPVGSESSSGR
jgi:signal transduction histidine kinase